MTSNDFGFEALPRPRAGAVTPGALGPWTSASVGAVRHDPVSTRERGTSVSAGSLGGCSPITGAPVTGASATGLLVTGSRIAGALVSTMTVRNSINRKQYVYTTRVHAGGDGASGPYPEREQPA